MGNAVLVSVVYHTFAHDEGVETLAFEGRDHLTDGEIEFKLDDGSAVFASWVSEPVQYCIGTASHSFFNPSATKAIDCTLSPLWRGLKGHALEFAVQDPDHQVVEVRSEGGSVFLASTEQDRWLADVVAISAKKPYVGA